MKAAHFLYHAPTSTEEALTLLGEHMDDAKLLAGGQSLVPILALRLTRFGHLIDLNEVSELAFISAEDNFLTIGAMTRQATAERSAIVALSAPLLSRALPLIGHFQIRNRGTVGGSIAHADPASELPAVVVTLGAEMEIRSRQGTRRIPASEFFFSVWETSVATDEVLTAIHLPIWGAHSGFSIKELAWRRGDFAVAGAASAIHLDDSGRIDRVGLTLMGMGSTPIAASAAQNSLLERSPSEVDFAAAAEIAVAMTNPSDDVHASGAYRKKVARTLVEASLGAALEEAANG